MKAPPPDNFQAVQLNAASFTPKVESFLIIVDASSSMTDDYQGRDKFDLAKQTVSRINQTIPALSFKGGLAAFGAGSCLSMENAKSLYGMAPYKRADLDTGLASLTCASGTTPMSAGLKLGQEKLEGSTGKVAVILVSDAWDIHQAPALEATRNLKKSLGSNLCIYTIQIGKDEAGKALLADIADIGECGFATNADDISSGTAMADYVTKVLLTAAPPPVVAAPVAAVDGDGDGDGVPDSRDKCPNTPPGVKVNAIGCWEFKGLLFDVDKTVIKDPASLDEAIRILKANPKMTGEIRGHTDSTGSAKHNQKLSEGRANAVRDYLIHHGIAAERIRAVGFGMNSPVASNDTVEGRAMNRRVELEPDR